MQHRIEQHRSMPDGKNKTVAIRPDGVFGVKAEEPLPQAVHDRSHRHRRTGVTRVGLLDSVHGQRADRVDRERVKPANGHRCTSCFLTWGSVKPGRPQLNLGGTELHRRVATGCTRHRARGKPAENPSWRTKHNWTLPTYQKVVDFRLRARNETRGQLRITAHAVLTIEHTWICADLALFGCWSSTIRTFAARRSALSPLSLAGSRCDARRPLIRVRLGPLVAQLALGLQPIFQLTAGFAPASLVDFIGAP